MNMRDKRDRIELQGKTHASQTANAGGEEGSASRPFLSVMFRCCHVYGRMNRTKDGQGYLGRCPKCARVARATVGPGGSSQTIFEAR